MSFKLLNKNQVVGSSPAPVAKALKLESDFETSIFRCGIVKILVNPLGFTAFLSRTPQNPLFTKFCDLKGAVFCVGFGEDKHIRLAPMCANEPKAAKNQPFKAGSGLNALANFMPVYKQHYHLKLLLA